MNTSKTIADFRKERGWSQTDLSKESGTSGAVIGRYEREEITPSQEIAKKNSRCPGGFSGLPHRLG